MILEVCANSFQSAKNAQLAGAHRIELCQELSVGGVTPSFGLLKSVLSELAIETFVLIRPRSGGFCYSDTEFEIMKQDIIQCKNMGCHGLVSGVLLDNGHVDMARTKALIALSKPLPFTFHRAFDCVPDPIQSLKDLITLGVSRVLTSGQQPSAENGLDLLKQMDRVTGNDVVIMPGSGIHPENVHLFKDAGFKEIHASASVVLPQDKNQPPFDVTLQTVSNIKTVQSILKQIQ